MSNYTSHDAPQEIPDGYCHCGCGQRTPLVKSSCARMGYKRGQPYKYCSGHNRQRAQPFYVVDGITRCWIWQRAKTRTGYGKMAEDGHDEYAHRVFYKRYKGSIPAGYDIDHLCRNTSCVNPEHLEAVPHAINNRRGVKALINIDIARQMRAIHQTAGLNARQIASQSGVSRALVVGVLLNYTWRE